MRPGVRYGLPCGAAPAQTLRERRPAGPEIRDDVRVEALFDPSIWEATVSVICERNEFETAKNEHQRNLAVDFSSKLLERGFNVRVFDPAGMDTIGGGCGQLWFVQDWMRQNPDKARPSVGHGLEKVHTPRGCDTKPITLHRSIASV